MYSASRPTPPTSPEVSPNWKGIPIKYNPLLVDEIPRLVIGHPVSSVIFISIHENRVCIR